MQIVINIPDEDVREHIGESIDLSLDVATHKKISSVWSNDNGYKEYSFTILKPM